MFGMNAEDAQRALEDLSIFNSVYDATTANLDLNGQAMRQAAQALRARNERIAKLRQQLEQQKHERDYAANLFFAAAATLDHVIRDFSRAAGVPEEAMRQRYNEARTQRFNNLINEDLDRGVFARDPRSDMSAEQKKWYIPGLDNGRGF